MKVMDEFIARVTNANIIKGLQADIRGFCKASDAILSLYIKEIDVLTKEKLTAIRRMRAILTTHERREAKLHRKMRKN